jgi:hypothetical protein
MKLEEFIHGVIYTPKGSMCMACKDHREDCSRLDFASMPLIEKHQNQFIVKCKSYKPRVNPYVSLKNIT